MKRSNELDDDETKTKKAKKNALIQLGKQDKEVPTESGR